MLHDPSAIGLQVEHGNIKLFPFQRSGWMSGIHLIVNSCHYRQGGNFSNSMTLLGAELQIPGPSPGPHPDYKGLIEGWEYRSSQHGRDIFMPAVSQFLPDYTDFTTFAMTDAYNEEFPYFYFGWGSRTEQLQDIGYCNWTNTAHLGLNYPVRDNIRPVWGQVPPEILLHNLLQPYIPEGNWRFRVTFSGFTVDSDVTADSEIHISIVQGRKRFYRGSLDYVSETEFLVGEDDGDLSGVQWGRSDMPGELILYDGDGAGTRFDVTNVYKTADVDPPNDLPPSTWIIRVGEIGPSPFDVGAKPGDRFMLTSRYFYVAYILYKNSICFLPGNIPPLTFEGEFEPKY